MRAATLDKALPSIAGFIADRTGIPVIRADRARTNNKAIYLPQRRSELDIDETDLVKSVGFIYHEAAHMLHSNFELSAKNPLQRAVTGVLEDVRIEHLIMKKFPGARRYLSRLVEIMVSEGAEGLGGFPVMKDEDPEAKIFQFYMLYRLRYEVLRQQPMHGVAESAIDVARKKFTATMLTRLDALMFQVTDCTSEDEVFQLADLIIEMMKDEKEKEEERKKQEQKQDANDQQQDQPQTGDDGDEDSDNAPTAPSAGQDGPKDEDDSGQSKPETTDEEGNDVSPPDEGQPGEDQSASSPSGTGDESESGDESGASSTQSASTGDEPTEIDAPGVLGSVLGMSEDDVQQDIGTLLEQALNAAADSEPKTGVCVPMPNNFKCNNKAADVDLATIRGSINAIRTRTLQWMASVSEEETVHSRSGMLIDSSRLWSARFGAPVFVKTDEGIDLNAAVSIVIDRSGSMSNTIVQAAQAAVATMLAFDVPGIKTQVMAFPWYENQVEGVCVLKRWQESPRQLAGRVTNINVAGCTPMAEALLYAASDIVRRDESLKLIVLLTDGEPDDKAATVHMIERARESGITVVALGIGVDPSAVFGPKYAASISNVGEMASSMVRLVKTAFEERRTLK